MLDSTLHELRAGRDVEMPCVDEATIGLSQPPTALHTVPDGQHPY
jgi:hypothetical protein